MEKGNLDDFTERQIWVPLIYKKTSNWGSVFMRHATYALFACTIPICFVAESLLTYFNMRVPYWPTNSLGLLLVSLILPEIITKKWIGKFTLTARIVHPLAYSCFLLNPEWVVQVITCLFDVCLTFSYNFYGSCLQIIELKCLHNFRVRIHRREMKWLKLRTN